MTFMPFVGLQTFKVKLFSENLLWSNILNPLQTKATPKNPHSCIFFSIILKKWEFWQTYFFSFGLEDDQKSFIYGRLQQHIFAFLNNHYGFPSYFEMLSYLAFNNIPRKVSLCNLLCSKFWTYFQAEMIPKNLMFLDFLTVFLMVWKNQESCDS